MHNLQRKTRGFVGLLRQLRAYDRLTLCYLTVVVLFVWISPHRPAAALRITLVHGAAICIIFLFAHFSRRSRPLKVLHDFYPMLLFMVLFSEFTQLSTVLFPYWFEPLLIRFDLWAFGGSPLRWIATHLSPPLAEAMAFAYGSYYILIPVSLLLVYKKSYPHELIAATTRMCLTMYACYVLFMLAPARGPHHALATNGAYLLQGGFFTNLVHAIQRLGSVQGAAFPSSHVAVAWAMLFVLQRFYPKVAVATALLVAALTLSVVALGYHFSLDAIGGMVVAVGINSAWREKRPCSANNHH